MPRDGDEVDMRNDFETALTQLQQIVTAMESGELSLQQSLELFEQGVRLSRECQDALQAAEQKVVLLTHSVVADAASDLASLEDDQD
jgi:exodeoxyribonuclease VII small subunit